MIHYPDLKNSILKNASDFSGHQLEFLKRIFDKGLTPYDERIMQYGIKDKQVLDAGCGFGQWSLSLSNFNTRVTSIELDARRVQFVKNVIQDLEIDHIEIKQSDVTCTHLLNESFDFIFAYSVLPFVDWKKALKEFYRLLKPNGELYINANGRGWYLKLMIENYHRSTTYNPREYGISALINTFKYQNHLGYSSGAPLVIEKEECKKTLITNGFKPIEVADEGCLRIALEEAKLFFEGQYYQETGVYEVMARKYYGT